MSKTVGVSRARAASLSILAVAFLGSACSSGVNGPSGVPATPTPSPQKLSLVVRVSNTHFGNAVPSDFKLSVAYEGPTAATSTVDGAAAAVEVSIPRNVTYQVTASALDGYALRLSAGCSGTSTADAATCEVTASDAEVACDKALWDPVYTKDRLKVLKACAVATGVVMGTEIERDGDLEVWMTPDPKYGYLMRPGNEYSRGWFVIEVPCQLPIVQDDAVGTCDRFTGPRVRVPLVGEHIVVAAPWVEDLGHHNWGELHGATIVKLPR
jgi:hypothetical protein